MKFLESNSNIYCSEKYHGAIIPVTWIQQSLLLYFNDLLILSVGREMEIEGVVKVVFLLEMEDSKKT